MQNQFQLPWDIKDKKKRFCKHIRNIRKTKESLSSLLKLKGEQMLDDVGKAKVFILSFFVQSSHEGKIVTS